MLMQYVSPSLRSDGIIGSKSNLGKGTKQAADSADTEAKPRCRVTSWRCVNGDDR